MVLYVPVQSYAQQRSYRKINTQEVLKVHKKDNPAYAKRLDDWENDLPKVKVNKNQALQIPIVFHILSSTGATAPDLDQVKAQLDIINKAFGTYDIPINKDYPSDEIAKYYKLGASLGISFCIPDKIGNTAGINYIKTNVKEWNNINDMKDPKKGGFAPVQPKNVINVWVGALSSGFSGNATTPTDDDDIDGIVIGFNFFGDKKGMAKAPHNEGKTLVHLIGNYLGLKDLWNEEVYCGDDGVADTPIHNAPNDIITTEKNMRHISPCSGGALEMYMNYMDNSDDSLQTLFTNGQKERVLAALSDNGPRVSLTKGKGCTTFNTFVTSKQIKISANELQLYPNPTAYELNLDMTSTTSGNATISILNSLGTIISEQPYSMEKGLQKTNLDCSSLSNGLYFVRVQFADKSFITKNLSIQH